jgi:hypothetical protein
VVSWENMGKSLGDLGFDVKLTPGVWICRAANLGGMSTKVQSTQGYQSPLQPLHAPRR